MAVATIFRVHKPWKKRNLTPVVNAGATVVPESFTVPYWSSARWPASWKKLTSMRKSNETSNQMSYCNNQYKSLGSWPFVFDRGSDSPVVN